MRNAMIPAVLLVILVCGAGLFLPSNAAAAAPPTIHAAGAALIDVQSGRILYSKQGNSPMRIASLTKIMTAIVAIESGELSDQVTVSSKAFGTEGSSIYLKKGQKMSLQNLLYGLMLRSGNDAAVAIAEHVGGSVEGFAYLMNEKAEWLGLKHTHFMNPNGLDVEDHYSSANDLAELTAYALKNPVFREIVKTKVKTVPNPEGKWNYRWSNKNKMLFLYKGADGVKTGYTKLARRCLVSSATRGGQQLVAVTLNDSYDWADHQLLLDYGFKMYPEKKLIGKGSIIPSYDLAAGNTVWYPLNGIEDEAISRRVSLIQENSTEYDLGLRGRLTFYLMDKPIVSVPLFDPGSQLMWRKNGTSFQSLVSRHLKERQVFIVILQKMFQSLFLSSTG